MAGPYRDKFLRSMYELTARGAPRCLEIVGPLPFHLLSHYKRSSSVDTDDKSHYKPNTHYTFCIYCDFLPSFFLCFGSFLSPIRLRSMRPLPPNFFSSPHSLNLYSQSTRDVSFELLGLFEPSEKAVIARGVMLTYSCCS